MDRDQVATRWRGLTVTVRDLPLAALVAVAPLVPSLQHQGTQLGDVPHRPVDALAVAAVALQSAPLAVRRRLPAVCLALVALGFAVDQVRGYHSVASIALPVALVSTAAHLDRFRRTTAFVASAAYVPLAVALDRSGAREQVSGYLTFYLVLAAAWCVGVWLRQSRTAEAEHRAHAAEGARVAERTRIAHELHDVVTHHVTAMVVQAEAARYRTADPAALDETLTAVTDTGRRAITDLRHLLDVLDPGHDAARADPRAPAVGDIAGLVEQTRRAGQPVELAEEGDPPASAGSAEATAYRVVQEALTNALKHAHGRATTVHVRHGDEAITVEVRTDGTGDRSPAAPGGGRGLVGLRRRVDVLGGELSASGQPGGAFVVHARIPSGTPS
ncbi:sensor histidine kinase [Cellulomonas cellasea]|uniref:histidine kinase n=1 Tax=Cellulomonas cellasea TaxID=43670 RepID=A0A7W4UG53_9CELL|nr:sensor histidine kinase [Cellulomonas cellasea]MBB2923000.1 signal transduction histidine kinase [Cellulomonas cellasea]